MLEDNFNSEAIIARSALAASGFIVDVIDLDAFFLVGINEALHAITKVGGVGARYDDVVVMLGEIGEIDPCLGQNLTVVKGHDDFSRLFFSLDHDGVRAAHASKNFAGYIGSGFEEVCKNSSRCALERANMEFDMFQVIHHPFQRSILSLENRTFCSGS